MQTNLTALTNTLSATLKPWAALARDASDRHTEHMTTANEILTTGAPVAGERLAQLASRAAIACARDALKAARLAVTQSNEALAGSLAKAPAAAAPAVDFVKKAQEQLLSTQDQFLALIEKTLGTFVAAQPAHKASRAA